MAQVLSQKISPRKVIREKKKRVGNAKQGVDMKRSCPQRQLLEKFEYILCGEETGTVHEFITFNADANINKMTTELEDTTLLDKLEGGDFIALGESIT